MDKLFEKVFHLCEQILDIDVFNLMPVCTNDPMQQDEPNRFLIKYRLCKECLELFDYRQNVKTNVG